MANHTDRAHWLGASMLAIIVAATAVPAMAQDAIPQADSAPQDDAPPAGDPLSDSVPF